MIGTKASNAFQSLCFKTRVNRRARIYGGILKSKEIDGKEMYALVQGSYTGKWSFPKGHSNKGEEPIECTLREIAEEIGVDVLPSPSEYMQIGYGGYFVFNVREMVELVTRDTKEVINTKWVSLEEMGDMVLNADVSLYRKKQLNIIS